MNIRQNIALSVCQVVITSVLLFLQYKILFKAIGADGVGTWSIVFTLATLAGVGDIGFGRALTQLTSKNRNVCSDSEVALIIETAAVSSAVVASLVGVLVLLLWKEVVALIIPKFNIDTGSILMPFAVATFIGTSILGVAIGALEGYERNDQAALLKIGIALVNFSLIAVTAEKLGAMAIGIGTAASSSVGALAGFVLVCRLNNRVCTIPRRFRISAFKPLYQYSLMLQFGSLARLSFEPTAKLLIARFGGATDVGYFELATKMILQIRSALVAANQVLLPIIARLWNDDKEKTIEIYKNSVALMIWMVLPIYSSIAVLAPVINAMWLGSGSNKFSIFATMLTLAWGINTIAGPAYVANLAIGRTAQNTKSDLLIGTLNIGLGIIGGMCIGAEGVVFGWSAALSLGSLWLIRDFRRKTPGLDGIIKSAADVMLLVTGGLILTGAYLNLSNTPGASSSKSLNLQIAISLIIIALIAWFHPSRKVATRWLMVSKYKIACL
jgi:O-antigen/teichoic acid export membrane protein